MIYWLVIFTEITDKYRKKVAKLEEQINNILHEEWEERVMQRTENQANRAEKILKKECVGEMPRSWFQSHKQREDEKGTISDFLHLLVYTLGPIRITIVSGFCEGQSTLANNGQLSTIM